MKTKKKIKTDPTCRQHDSLHRTSKKSEIFLILNPLSPMYWSYIEKMHGMGISKEDITLQSFQLSLAIVFPAYSILFETGYAAL
jgi:hypothetical protein